MSRHLWAVILVANLIMIINFTGNLITSINLVNRLSPPKIGGAGRFSARRWYENSGVAYATTSTTTTEKLQDLALGKVVQSGSLKFVKVGDNQYVAKNICPEGSTYSSFYKGCVVKTTTYSYTGNYQTFTAPATGMYVVELWGASSSDGLDDPDDSLNGYAIGGKGGYTSGYITLNLNSSVRIYVGGQGKTWNYKQAVAWTNGGWNGGANCYSARTVCYKFISSGGGATDIRISVGDWNNASSLRSRVMVAGGGGGIHQNRCNSSDDFSITNGGNAGGNEGNAGTYSIRGSGFSNLTPTGGTQSDGGKSVNEWYETSYSTTYAGSFGAGATGDTRGAFGSGGGGWYGGASGKWKPGGGGSSYISGHTGCVAVTSTTDSTPKSGCVTGTTDNACSISPYGYTFTDTVMIDGAGYAWTNVKGALTPMPDPTSVGAYYASGVGHTGNGAARITQLSVYLGI